MFGTLTKRYRARFAPAAPWARWTVVALGSAAILSLATSAQWIRFSVIPALAIGLVQLGRLTRAAIRRPQLDREADDRLQVLVDRTCLPALHLIEVVATTQLSAAGQFADTVDLSTGQRNAVWFSQACFPTGALVLIDARPDPPRALDWMLSNEVQAAYRHRTRAARRRIKDEAAAQRELVEELAGSSPHPRPRTASNVASRPHAA